MFLQKQPHPLYRKIEYSSFVPLPLVMVLDESSSSSSWKMSHHHCECPPRSILGCYLAGSGE